MESLIVSAYIYSFWGKSFHPSSIKNYSFWGIAGNYTFTRYYTLWTWRAMKDNLTKSRCLTDRNTEVPRKLYHDTLFYLPTLPAAVISNIWQNDFYRETE
jgi:hypothetical protein